MKIRVNENQLKKIVKESVKRIIKEHGELYPDSFSAGRRAHLSGEDYPIPGQNIGKMRKDKAKNPLFNATKQNAMGDFKGGHRYQRALMEYENATSEEEKRNICINLFVHAELSGHFKAISRLLNGKTIDELSMDEMDNFMHSLPKYIYGDDYEFSEMNESRIRKAVNTSVRKVLREVSEPGSISHGTMNPEDLIPRFMSHLFRQDPKRARQIWKTYPNLLQALCDKNAGIKTDWWQSEEASEILNNDLFDEMDLHSPEGHHFGSHPGDGADYGYWPNEED